VVLILRVLSLFARRRKKKKVIQPLKPDITPVVFKYLPEGTDFLTGAENEIITFKHAFIVEL